MGLLIESIAIKVHNKTVWNGEKCCGPRTEYMLLIIQFHDVY